jgi:hypothetical protein
MSEQSRIDFLINRDGIACARKWAARTAKIYRQSVLQSRKRGYGIGALSHKKPHHASFPYYRRTFIESYLALKRFARAN